jgi:hypothetical protein
MQSYSRMNQSLCAQLKHFLIDHSAVVFYQKPCVIYYNGRFRQRQTDTTVHEIHFIHTGNTKFE